MVTAWIIVVLGIILMSVASAYFDRPWGRWQTHDYYNLRTWLGRHVHPSIHWEHEDEPLHCPICGRKHWRWEWSEARRADPTFRERYYNHFLSDGTYILPCVTCAVDKRDLILASRGGR